MPIITPSSLTTHLYPEVLNEIARNDDAIVTSAIDAAIQETKMYLGRYDLIQLFGTETEDPTVPDEMLAALVKDITCWHLIRLANIGMDYTLFRTAYQDALATLKAIMNGSASPQRWPYLDVSEESVSSGDTIAWNSNPPRDNHY